MRGYDPSERYALEMAAKEAGFQLESSDYHSYALIVHEQHHVDEEFFSGAPLVFGRFPVSGKLGYYALTFLIRDGREIAQLKDKDGNVVSEHKAQLFVPRVPTTPSPQYVIGGPGCWLKVRAIDRCLWVHASCRGHIWGYSSCD